LLQLAAKMTSCAALISVPLAHAAMVFGGPSTGIQLQRYTAAEEGIIAAGGDLLGEYKRGGF
jgi:hypothetical protein